MVKAPVRKTGDLWFESRLWHKFFSQKLSSISCVVPGPSQWFFHFGEETVITLTHIGWVRWMIQNLPFPAAQEVLVNSNVVTPCVVKKTDVVLYYQVSFSPQSLRLRSLHQSERTTARDPVQYKRWTYSCSRAVNTEHQWRWTRWCCTTSYKPLPKC